MGHCHITITRDFSARHAIMLPTGVLEPSHEHRWRVRVAVTRRGLDAIETVMDFHALEAIVGQVIAPARDRSLNDLTPFAAPDGHGAFGSLAVNPTAERVAWWISQAVQLQLPTPVELVSVTVTEAPGCEATWFPAEP